MTGSGTEAGAGSGDGLGTSSGSGAGAGAGANHGANAAAGPLAGVRIIELAGIGPAPYGCMLLADLGADVVTIDRAQPGLQVADPRYDLLRRGRRSIVVDLKRQEGRDLVLRLVDGADALVEGYRPGVTERLGIGPQECLQRNPRLVYARMTGWGQDGPLAQRAGHDITYLALAGALAHIGRAGAPPTPPLNLVADFGGGGMFLALGVLAGVLQARRTGRGDVVDVAMVDGVASLMTMFSGLAASGTWDLAERGGNMLDSGMPTYDVYRTADDEYVAVGALEPQFWAELRSRLGLADVPESAAYDRQQWPALRARLEAVFASRTREEWTAEFDDSDACVAPVLRLDEAADHPQLTARRTYVKVEGVAQSAPAPRFAQSPQPRPGLPARPGEHTDEVLRELGVRPEEVARLRATGVLG